MRHLALLATTTICLAMLFAAPAVADRGAARFLQPVSVSSECAADARRRDACGTVERFFRALNSQRYGVACSLLGHRLREETHGMSCAGFLAAASPGAVPWGILGASRSGASVAILVQVGQSELGYFRMRHHLAYVGLENGVTRILTTGLVR